MGTGGSGPPAGVDGETARRDIHRGVIAMGEVESRKLDSGESRSFDKGKLEVVQVGLGTGGGCEAVSG